MSPLSRRVGVCVFLGAAARATALESAAVEPPVVQGLDHIPIAVRNLEEAAARYRALGFTLKPGRPHDNGIRNQHAKFADGTELELITAPEALDPLTTTYRRHLEQGDGPAFLALLAPSRDAAAARLDAGRIRYERGDPFLSLDDRDRLGYLFLGPRNHSPTDRPEHFVHANGASSLRVVWLAGDLQAERQLLVALGARFETLPLWLPDRMRASVARFAEGDVVLLPRDRQLVAGRPIVGATLRVPSLAPAEAVLARSGEKVPARVRGAEGTSLFLPPAVTHGLWLELRESP
jgi:catechol 2,3-dioxygenase-like lactoylglutathione lyase family enzyme